MSSGSRHEVPYSVSGKEVLGRGVAVSLRPDLVEVRGRIVAGQIVGVTDPPWPEIVEAGGRRVSGRIVEAGGDVFGVILIVFRV